MSSTPNLPSKPLPPYRIFGDVDLTDYTVFERSIRIGHLRPRDLPNGWKPIIAEEQEKQLDITIACSSPIIFGDQEFKLMFHLWKEYSSCWYGGVFLKMIDLDDFDEPITFDISVSFWCMDKRYMNEVPAYQKMIDTEYCQSHPDIGFPKYMAFPRESLPDEVTFKIWMKHL